MNPIPIACVIDDDPIYSYAIRKMIDHAGIAQKTLFFPDGAPALDFFRACIHQPKQLPDLILLDLNMPVVGGWDFLEAYTELLPQISKKITIYILSSSIYTEDHKRAASIPAVSGMLIKPISQEQLRLLAERAAD